MNDRYYYANQISEFLKEDSNQILGQFVSEDEFESIQLTQKEAWRTEISLLKKLLTDKDKGQILFEYSIPRLGKRVDVVLILNGVIFVLEFKGNQDYFSRMNIDQVWDYALDLKNFHEESHDKVIVPFLVIPEADDKYISTQEAICVYDDSVYEPICTNEHHLRGFIDYILEKETKNADYDATQWLTSRYSPTPTIIEAASYLFNNHTVENIKRSDATGEQLDTTTSEILDIIEKAKENHEKAICFVTGVPGAGKTLVGLRVAISQFQKDEESKSDLAVYLSGNQPLVSVLSEALARDKQRNDDEREPDVKHPITEARRQVKSFIQIVHHYRNNALAKIKLENGKLSIDETKVKNHKEDGYSEVDHVAIFDEAQRAWTKDQLANWLSRKKNIQGFPMSEPAFLIWSLDLRPDWAVIVCLVGGGQEINTGEAGITEWISALNENFPNWKVYISSNLKEKEYAEGAVESLLAENKNVSIKDGLHLAVSMRSFRTEKLSLFVHHFLERNIEETRELYKEIIKQYPIYLTRDLSTAKKWIKKQARGTERYGIVVSSQAYRLRPLAIDVRAKPDTVHWFLDDDTDIRSSLFMEDVATEFDVQGLELDWSCVVWDGDLRCSDKGWENYAFNGGKWQNINALERKRYQINAYRVLLTRARQGMVLVVPEGDDEDVTRKKKFYDTTYRYMKDIGIIELD